MNVVMTSHLHSVRIGLRPGHHVNVAAHPNVAFAVRPRDGAKGGSGLAAEIERLLRGRPLGAGYLTLARGALLYWTYVQ